MQMQPCKINYVAIFQKAHVVSHINCQHILYLLATHALYIIATYMSILAMNKALRCNNSCIISLSLRHLFGSNCIAIMVRGKVCKCLNSKFSLCI